MQRRGLLLRTDHATAPHTPVRASSLPLVLVRVLDMYPETIAVIRCGVTVRTLRRRLTVHLQHVQRGLVDADEGHLARLALVALPGRQSSPKQH